MRHRFHWAALLLCSLTLSSQQSVYALDPSKDDRLNNPWVRGVLKTRDSIVKLNVLKEGHSKDVIGTGVIIDERGYVVTNYHVVRDQLRVNLTLRDKTVLRATVHLTLPAYDLAVVKISTKKRLQALRLGPASDLIEAEDVMAIGHPFGYAMTVTKGNISSLEREVVMPSGVKLSNLIQHSAPINPGNSGGALLNQKGELIGINVALRKGAQNIAFALNADDVQRVLSRHLSAWKVSGLRHGLNVHETVKAWNAADRQSVVVEEVSTATPASRAGLQKGDVIVNVGNRKVANRFDVERSLWNVKSDTVPVTIYRRGLKLQLELKVPVETVSNR